jgi:hypothetical protein
LLMRWVASGFKPQLTSVASPIGGVPPGSPARHESSKASSK